MTNELHWTWRHETYYRENIARIKQDARNRILTLPAPLNAPMFGIIAHRLIQRLERCPEPAVIDEQELDRVFLKQSELFLARHCGVDLDRTVLIEPWHFILPDKTGFRVRHPVIQFWCDGLLGVTTSDEWRLDETYYVDRLLMQNELQHACDLE